MRYKSVKRVRSLVFFPSLWQLGSLTDKMFSTKKNFPSFRNFWVKFLCLSFMIPSNLLSLERIVFQSSLSHFSPQVVVRASFFFQLESTSASNLSLLIFLLNYGGRCSSAVEHKHLGHKPQYHFYSHTLHLH